MIESREPWLTIITPTYNRRTLLPRLRETLLSNDTSGAEWIILDDASSDDTWSLIEQWPTEQQLPIRVVRHEVNSGKHVALNTAVSLARGEFCFIVDSDDWLPADALTRIHSWVQKLPDELGGVAGLKGHEDGTPIGGAGECGPGEFVDCTNLERGRRRLLGDKAEIYRTRVLRDFPFPVFPRERFLDEAVVWNRIARAGLSVRWYGDVIYYCVYLPGGLTDTLSRQRNQSIAGYRLLLRESLPDGSARARLSMCAYYASLECNTGRRATALAHEIGVATVWLRAARLAEHGRKVLRRKRAQA